MVNDKTPTNKTNLDLARPKRRKDMRTEAKTETIKSEPVGKYKVCFDKHSFRLN